MVSEEQEQEKSRSSDGSDRGGSGADLHRKLVLGSAFDSWPSFKRFQFVAKQGGERPIIESGHTTDNQGIGWCRWRGSNPHVLTDTRF